MINRKIIKNTFGLVFLAVLLVSLTSCLSVKKEVSSNGLTATGLRPVYVTNKKKVNLLKPEVVWFTFDGIQLLEGSFGDTSFTLLSYTQIDATGISLSLMNDFGTDMGTVSYDGSKVVFDSAYFPKNLPGEYIICDIQNAFYDIPSLEENYKNAGLTFEATLIMGETGTPVLIRRIYDGKKLIEEISDKDNAITIKNYLRGYEYNLTRIEE